MRETVAVVQTSRFRYTLQRDLSTGLYWMVVLSLETGEEDQGGPFLERFGRWVMDNIVQLEKALFHEC